MTITHDQVVDSLIAFYKHKGVDTTYLLEDPLFDKLPVEVKVSAIKKHADALRSGSTTGWNKEEKSNLYSGAIMGGIGGVGTAALAIPVGIKALEGAGISLAKGMAFNKAVAATIGGGAILGGILGALSGGAKGKIQADARRSVVNQLHSTSKNPSDMNAIGVMSTRNMYNRQHSFRNAILDRVSDKMDSVTGVFNEKMAPGMFANTYAIKDPNVTLEQFHRLNT